MSEGMNKVLLAGNLCKDPEGRQGQGGGFVLRLRMVTNERYKDRDDKWQTRAEYHNVVVFGRRGEALAKILANGSWLMVEGSLRTSSSEKDGVTRYFTDVIANNVILPTGQRFSQDDGGGSDDGQAPAQSRGGDRGSSQHSQGGGGRGGGQGGRGNGGGGNYSRGPSREEHDAAPPEPRGGGHGGGGGRAPADPNTSGDGGYGGGGDDDIPF